MKRSEAKKKIQEMIHDQEVSSFASNLNRAKSVTVGTAFGGVTEISMRGDGNQYLWCLMQPVEVIELIHQLAANVGCHIAIKPRNDFGSWREWRLPEIEKKHLNGQVPFVNDMAVFQRLGAAGFNQQEAEKVVEEWLSQKEYEYVNGAAQIKKDVKNETLATNKSTNKRKTKRTSEAA